MAFKKQCVTPTAPGMSNELLLAAVRERNAVEVENLLQNPNIDLNRDIGDGNTVFFESLFCNDYEIFISLLCAGCNVNHAGKNGGTPLHMAIVHSPANFVRELVKKGADTNVELHCLTPLQLAISLGKVEKVCILLYYKTEVSIASTDTTLSCALKNNNVEIARLLINYYEGIYYKSDSISAAAAHGAITLGNPLAVDILKTRDFEYEYCNFLQNSLKNENSELFRVIWDQFGGKIHLDVKFLLDFFDTEQCQFPCYEWLECLHMMLNTHSAFSLFQEHRSIYVMELSKEWFLMKLLSVLYERNVLLNDRLATIYLFLSFGIKVTSRFVNFAYLLYGFNKEVEALLYAFSSTSKFDYDFIFVLEKMHHIRKLFNYLVMLDHLDDSYCRFSLEHIKEELVMKSLRFCSLSHREKRQIVVFCESYLGSREHALRKLFLMPEMPSLLELCRNRIRAVLCQNASCKNHRFYDAIKQLNLPPHLKDVVYLKAPIY